MKKPTVPSVARMCDYLLAGKDHLDVDRQCAEEAVTADPAIRQVMLENRSFTHRVVRHLAAECGITQFIDIGMGFPGPVNVHQVAQQVNPRARVAYVDHDPVVVAHGQALLTENDRTIVVKGDVRDPEGILGRSAVSRLMDLSRPVAVLLTPVLSHLSDEDRPADVMGRFHAALSPGSHLAVSHACPEARPDAVGRVMKVYRRTTAPITARSRERIRGFFGEFELLEPGLVWLPAWRPESPGSDAVDRVWLLGGVARKPRHGKEGTSA